MVFNSYEFALFLPVVLGAYWILRNHRRQNLLLVLASYVFYAAWDPRFLVLMWFTTAVDYAVGRAIQASDDDRRRRRILSLSLAANLGVLGTFKYFNFFIGSGSRFLQRLGLQSHPPVLRILLPVGISFYTFHGISYTVDVYRRRVSAVHDPVTFAAFVSYFPQLVAGPIGRAEVQLPQFEHPRAKPNREQVFAALTTIFIGFLKKIVIADSLAPYVNEKFAAPHGLGAFSLLLGAYAFALEIYGDFSGYTDIARGVSQLFGISLLENFRQPYFSASITEFWRRWHISLSTWLRDYLYVPLGGNRGSRSSTYRNLFLTMLIGGLWHGAAWTFVAWGGLHGAYLVTERWWRDRHPGHVGARTGARRVVATIVTFHVVTLTWVFFRAPNFHLAHQYLAGIFSTHLGTIDWSLLVLLALSATLMLAIDASQALMQADDAIRSWSPVPRGALLGVAAVLFLVFSGSASEPFIYFQF